MPVIERIMNYFGWQRIPEKKDSSIDTLSKILKELKPFDTITFYGPDQFERQIMIQMERAGDSQIYAYRHKLPEHLLTEIDQANEHAELALRGIINFINELEKKHER